MYKGNLTSTITYHLTAENTNGDREQYQGSISRCGHRSRSVRIVVLCTLLALSIKRIEERRSVMKLT
jgi:hypothetical protein